MQRFHGERGVVIQKNLDMVSENILLSSGDAEKMLFARCLNAA